jgi:pyrimidine-nucleoside phosphorylase
MLDIITLKRDGKKLGKSEIEYFIKGVVSGEIPDYQISALLMAITLNSMDIEEIVDLTKAMAKSGKTLDLSGIPGIKVDKHSTGGVGDKTTLICGPLAATLGVPVVKMSGRGLGHTGGTIDKLESIPGFRTGLSEAEFIDNVKKIGFCITAQTNDIASADKKLYSLRDVTATVDSIPLIASSIMSKKFAMGADAILLDVKCGIGAFMKNNEDAQKLADTMVMIGNSLGKQTRAVISDMNQPLGRAVGNSIEVIEAIEALKGNATDDLMELCIELASNMLELSEISKLDEGRELCRKAVASGQALEKLRQMITLQGGNPKVIDDYSLFGEAKYSCDVRALQRGVVYKLDSYEIGRSACVLGAGREEADSKIDLNAGVYVRKKVGDVVEVNEILATFYTNKAPEEIQDVAEGIRGAYYITK